MQAFYTYKLNEGLSRRTVQYIHAVLHRALNQALKWELIPRNVTDLVDAPKPIKKQFTTWSVNEVRLFLEAVEDHLYYLIYVTAIYCGLRQGEILGLYVEDVDLDKGVVHVQRQLTRIKGEGLVLTKPKTEKSIRPVSIPNSVLKVFENHLELIKRDQKLLFTTRSGRPISARNVVRHFKSVIKTAGLPEIRFHDLRHTHATLLLTAGVHPKIVQERLGHSQISLTLDTYSHVIPSLQDRAADQFDELMMPI